MDLLGGTFSAAVTCTTVPRHYVFAECEPNWKCFRLAEEILLRQFAKSALARRVDVTLREKEARTAEVVAELVPEVERAALLRSSPDGLQLY